MDGSALHSRSPRRQPVEEVPRLRNVPRQRGDSALGYCSSSKIRLDEISTGAFDRSFPRAARRGSQPGARFGSPLRLGTRERLLRTKEKQLQVISSRSRMPPRPTVMKFPPRHGPQNQHSPKRPGPRIKRWLFLGWPSCRANIERSGNPTALDRRQNLRRALRVWWMNMA